MGGRLERRLAQQRLTRQEQRGGRREDAEQPQRLRLEVDRAPDLRQARARLEERIVQVAGDSMDPRPERRKVRLTVLQAHRELLQPRPELAATVDSVERRR